MHFIVLKIQITLELSQLVSNKPHSEEVLKDCEMADELKVTIHPKQMECTEGGMLSGIVGSVHVLRFSLCLQ